MPASSTSHPFLLAVLALPLLSLPPAAPAFADSLVKSKRQCARYDGAVKPSGNPYYPWICSTPARDKKCRREEGPDAYFDADRDRCTSKDMETFCEVTYGC